MVVVTKLDNGGIDRQVTDVSSLSLTDDGYLALYDAPDSVIDEWYITLYGRGGKLCVYEDGIL